MKTNKMYLQTKLVLMVVGLCAALLSGCADLKGIRKFSDSAADTASYTGLTSYYLGEFDHSKRYEEDAVRQKQLDQESALRRKQEKALLGLHRGVQDYMKALGALASDEVVNYDQSLKKLGDEIKDTKLISDSKVEAYRGIAALIAKAATDGYRQRKLKLLIGEGNVPFQQIAEALSKIVRSGYVLSLDNEKAVMDSYYQEVVKVAQPNDPGTEMVKETWRTKKEDLAARRQACLAYAETIEIIAQGHQELFNNRDKLDTKASLDTIISYAQEVDDLRTKIKELTKIK